MNTIENNEYIIEFKKANIYSFFLSFFLVVFLLLVYYYCWNENLFSIELFFLKWYSFPILIIGVIFHELLHGITWAIGTKMGLKSIKFGFHWKTLTPYCHCKDSLKVKIYKLGIFMPLFLMGIIPLMLGLISGRQIIYFYGLLFTCISTGDVLVLYHLRKIKNNKLVLDHPNKMGFKVQQK